MNTKILGNFGEKIAEDYLKKKGYRILDRNFQFKIAGNLRGEIDIIAEKKGIISFIEVKTLQSNYIQPEDKVNFLKQKKLIKSAEIWLIKNKIPLDKKWQIDIISIKTNLFLKKAKIRHFKNI